MHSDRPGLNEMAESASSSSSSDHDRRARIQKSVLKSKHQELRDKMNFHSIYPHLNSHGLVAPTLNQVELVDELGTSQRKIDKVLAHMPECGNPDYLDEFVVCLKVSNYGTGDAHNELAETIEKAYKSEMERSVSPEIVGVSVSVSMHGGRGLRHLLTGNPGKVVSSKNLKRCICYCSPISTMVFVAILTIIILLKVPHLSDIMYTPNVTASHSVIEVEFDSKAAFWTAEANISVNSCNSSVIVVQGKTCSSLPTTERNDSIYDTHMPLSPVYFLEGSYMNLSDIDNSYTNKILWILSTKDYLGSKNGSSIKEECDPPHECDSPNHDSESCCYYIQDYPGGNIPHQITKSDFYFATSWPKPEYHTFDVFYTAVVYDLDTIIRLPGAKAFPRTAKISDWFDFQSTKCILLNTTCPSNIGDLRPTALSNVSRRTDTLLLALILEFVVSVVGTGLALLCKLTVLKDRRCCAKRSTATYEEFEPSDATALIESTSYPHGRVYNVTIST